MVWEPDGDALRGKVAMVAEATVICTGRSSTSGNATSDYDHPETVEEIAHLVDDLGGTGVVAQTPGNSRSTA